MSVSLSLLGGAGWQFFDNSGNVLSGGLLYTYAAGTTTPLTTYTSLTGLTANTNPIILDSAGRVPNQIWMTDGVGYKLILQNAVGGQIGAWDNITSQNTASVNLAASAISYTAAGSVVVRTVQAKLQESVSVLDFGAVGDGVADDTAAIQAAISSTTGCTIYFPPGEYKCTSQILINGKTGLVLQGSRNAKLLFTDGSYIGLLFTNSNQCKVENLKIYGTNTTTPAITLLKATTNTAYFTIQDCQFAYASRAIFLAQSYIVRFQNNNYSNCDQYVFATNAEGSVADLALVGETYGTSTIGASANVQIAYNDTRIIGCYWETMSTAKLSLAIVSPAQRVAISGCQFTTSGGIDVGTSNYVTINGCMFSDSYTSNRTIRINGGASGQVNGNLLTLTSLSATVVGVSSSGNTSVVGNFMTNFLQGIGSSGSGSITGNHITGCTTGISAGGTVVVANDNSFVSNTTNLVTSGSATATGPSVFTATLTGCTTSPTGTARYEVNNGVVNLFVPGISATSNSNACTITGLPTAIQPLGGINSFGSVVLVTDNGSQSAEQCFVSGSVLTLYKSGSATGFTASGTKGIVGCVITYRLRNVA